MKFSKHESGYIIRFLKGEEIVSAIAKFCKSEEIKSAVLQGIGSVENVELGFYHCEQKEYGWKKFDQPLEIVSLTGNIAQVDNEPFVHLHAVLSDHEFQTIGGHVRSAVISATCEISLMVVPQITRTLDTEIGLKLLDCEEEL